MLPTYREKETGKKLYPVCNWEKNQHILYNAHDRIMNAIYEGKAEWDAVDRIEKAMSAFDSHVVKGVVYATYEDSFLIRLYLGL